MSNISLQFGGVVTGNWVSLCEAFILETRPGVYQLLSRTIKR